MADESTTITDNSSTDLSEYQEILNKYTVLFENCRYDRLTYNAGESGIADIQYDANVMNTSYYRSFGTYRHELKSDSSLVRINETYVDEDELIKQYYNYNNSLESNKDTLIFAGIVLEYLYSTNGHDISLEDLFAEYGYDYLLAYDAYIKADPSTATDTSSFYFDILTDENKDSFTPGTYSILKIGETFTNYDELDDNGKPIVEEILYDGTYHPTVDEILSGNLYIVIQSGSLNPKKVYFNNKYLPTLFINDDKKYQAKNSEFFIEENYIINGLQGIKLCDIKTYLKLGTLIQWEYPFYISNLIGLGNTLNTKLQTELNTTIDYINENNSGISLMSYYLVRYKTTSQQEWMYQIYGNDMGTFKEITADMTNNGFLDPNNSTLVFTYKNNINNVNIGYLNKAASDTEGKIYLEIYFGMSLVLNGYSYEENGTTEDTTDTYNFYWFEKKTSTNYKWLDASNNEISTMNIKLGYNFLNKTFLNKNSDGSYKYNGITDYLFKLVDLNNNEVTNHSEDFSLTGEISKYMTIAAFGNANGDNDIYIILDTEQTNKLNINSISYNMSGCTLKYKDNSTILPLNITILQEIAVPLLLLNGVFDENTTSYSDITYLTVNGITQTLRGVLDLKYELIYNNLVSNVEVFCNDDLLLIKNALNSNQYIYSLVSFFNTDATTIDWPILLLSLYVNNNSTITQKNLKEFLLLKNYSYTYSSGTATPMYYRLYYIDE